MDINGESGFDENCTREWMQAGRLRKGVRRRDSPPHGQVVLSLLNCGVVTPRLLLNGDISAPLKAFTL